MKSSIVLMMVVSVLCFSCIANAGLVAEWRLDGDLTSETGNHDLWSVNPVNYTTGLYGQALDYEIWTPASDDVVRTGYSPALNADNFTVSAHVKLQGLAWNYRAVVSSSAFTPYESKGYIIYAGGGDLWEAWLATTDGLWVVQGPQVTYDNWNVVSLTYDDATGQVDFYVNGYTYTQNIRAYNALNDFVANDWADFRIGSSGNASADGGYYLIGDIDQVQYTNNIPEPATLALLGLGGLLLSRKRR